MDIGKIGDMYIDKSISNTNNTVSDKKFEDTLKKAVENKDDEELKKVCTEFEGIILDMMYKQMKATVSKSKLIPEDSGTEYFEGLLDEKIVEEASKTNSLGLAEQMYKQLSHRIKAED